MKSGYLTNINDLYGKVLEGAMITEKKEPQTFERASAKKPVGKKDSKKSPFTSKNSGPENAEGVKSIKESQKNTMVPEKNETKNINTSMSSKFNDLFSKVTKNNLHLEDADLETIDDINVDDLGAEPETGIDEPENTELGEQDIAELVNHLFEIATELKNHFEKQSSGSPEGGDDLESDDEISAETPETHGVSGEATEMEELKDTAGQTLQNKNNKVPSENTKLAKGGKADTKVTDKQGTEDTGVHPLVGEPAGVKKLQGKVNKVDATRGTKPGTQAFA